MRDGVRVCVWVCFSVCDVENGYSSPETTTTLNKYFVVTPNTKPVQLVGR